MTQEYQLGHYVKRLAVGCTLYGGVEEHLGKLAALSLDDAPPHRSDPLPEHTHP